MPTTTDFRDPDIIDHPEFANIYGGFGVFDSDGNGYLALPFSPPAKAEQGRRPLDEDQRRIQHTMAAWSIRAFQIARAAGWTSDAATQELEANKVMEVDSARTLGRRACAEVFGRSASKLDEVLRHHVETLKTEQGQEAVDTLVRSEFATFANLGRAHLRSRDFDARFYEAFHGRQPGTFHDKMAEAFNPRPTEPYFTLPIAAQLSFLTGVNLAFLWQQQWYYRLLLGTAAALKPWATRDDAKLLPEQLYVLYRCVETATDHVGYQPNEEQHDGVKRFLAHLVGDRPAFMEQAEHMLSAEALLPDRPRTVFELERHCAGLVDPQGDPFHFILSAPR